MDCIEPGSVTIEELLAFLDGEASAEIGAHLARCAGCAERVRAYAGMERRLHGALRRIDCPTPLLLGEYALQLLSPVDQTRLAAHVVGCPSCAAELDQLRGFMRAESAAPRPGPLERARRIVATLVAAPPRGAAAGLRGTETATTRTYEAGDVRLTLSVDMVAEGVVDLDGFAWREDPQTPPLAGRAVSLTALADTAAQATTVIDTIGNFTFEGIAAGDYRLEVTLEPEVIVIEYVRIAP
jgi:anti-sigma factor RsiW